jgi:hypothetical protein
VAVFEKGFSGASREREGREGDKIQQLGHGAFFTGAESVCISD